MGDNDFPAVMGNQPIGFVRQFMEKKGMYSQKGDNVPAFTNTMQVSQNQGGPLVAHGSHKPHLFLMRYQDIQIQGLIILWNIKDQ